MLQVHIVRIQVKENLTWSQIKLHPYLCFFSTVPSGFYFLWSLIEKGYGNRKTQIPAGGSSKGSEEPVWNVGHGGGAGRTNG